MNADRQCRVRSTGNEGSTRSEEDQADCIGKTQYRPQYWPRNAQRFCAEDLQRMRAWHALPQAWWTMNYANFLAARRPLIAGVIQAGYKKLSGAAA